MFFIPWLSRTRPRPPADSLPVAFVFGCARSGTSILGELIASHPGVHYVFEASKIWESAGSGEGESHRLTKDHATARTRRRIQKYFLREYETGAGRPGQILVEKCPRNCLRIPFLRGIYPQAKLIHIIRDGRDVACSLRPGIGGDKWSHLKPPNWRDLFTKYEGVIRCAHAWKAVVEVALADLEDTPHLEVRYEDLVRDPLATARRIHPFLGLEDDPAVAAFAGKVQDRTSDSYHAKFQDQWSRPDHQRRMGRWRENLSPAEQDAVQNLLSPLLTRLGYADG